MSDELDFGIETGVADFGSPDFTRFVKKSDATSALEINQVIDQLHQRKDNWAQLETSERIAILDEITADLIPIKNRWIETEFEAKGNSLGSGGEAEEWVILAAVFRAIRKLRSSLVEIQQYGRPKSEKLALTVFWAR